MSFSYNNTIFSTVVDLLTDFVDQCTFSFTKKYVEILTLDSNHVMLFSCKLYPDIFETYKIKKTTNVTIQLSEFNKILKCKKNGDVMKIVLGEDTLKISQVNEEKKKKCNYKMRLVNLDESNELDEMELEGNNYFVAKSSSLLMIYKDISKFGDNIKLKLEGNELTFSTSNNGNSVEMTYGENDDDILDIKNSEDVSVTILSKYLASILKSEKLSSEMNVYIDSPDFPILFDCKIRDKSYVKFFLSPKSDDDDE